jgi:hypothetical protein
MASKNKMGHPTWAFVVLGAALLIFAVLVFGVAWIML